LMFMVFSSRAVGHRKALMMRFMNDN